MPVVFDIIGLVNNVREPMNHDGDDLEDNPFVTDEENPLLRMDSIGRVFTRSKARATNRSKSNYFANGQTVRFNLRVSGSILVIRYPLSRTVTPKRLVLEENG